MSVINAIRLGTDNKRFVLLHTNGTAIDIAVVGTSLSTWAPPNVGIINVLWELV